MLDSKLYLNCVCGRQKIVPNPEKTRREGMITGLTWVLANGYPDKDCERRIRAEIDRPKGES